MDRTIQSTLSLALLLLTGQCVANVPTGEELFEMQQAQTERTLGIEIVDASAVAEPRLGSPRGS
ncbi:MAG: hypothetical protein IIB60_06220 [Planctomycetes bacterium]|nr:hypothetical protein [Planctomycetota bacterium]